MGMYTEIYKMIERAKETADKMRIAELKKAGVIVDACLVCHPQTKLILCEALHRAGVKKIPIVCDSYCEEDKLYMITDRDLVEQIKHSLRFDETV